jgi:CMP-N,N'-diacetyllegionaminic acid synthase
VDDRAGIVAAARAADAEVPFMRPAELATDEASSVDVALHALENIGEAFEYLCLLEPTSPLRSPSDMDGVAGLMKTEAGRTDAVVAVGHVHRESPFVCKTIDANGHLQPVIGGGLHSRRQDLPQVYFPYGGIYAVKAETLRRERTFYPGRTLPYFVERWQSYEIDDDLDFLVVQEIMRRKVRS